jgi:SprT-like family.
VKSSNKAAKGVSISLVRKIWAELNVLIFDGKLEEPYFRITRDRRNFGKFVWRPSDTRKNCAIFVSGVLNRGSLGHLRDTVAHEMVHQWQHAEGLDHNEHDETFTQWVSVIKEKAGITLQESWIEG